MSEGTQISTAGKGLGIAGLVLGICALAFSFIPCLGMYAMYPGAMAIVLSGVAFMQAKKENAPNGMIIAALIVSTLGTGIAVYQYTVFTDVANQIEQGLEKSLKEIKIDLENENENSDTGTETE